MEEFGVFGAALADGFEGEGGGFEQFEFEADVVEQVVGLIVEGVFFEFLFDEREGCQGILFGLAMEFHHAHAAGLQAEQAAFFLGAAGELEFAFAEQLAAFQESRAFLEDALKEGDGVVEVRGLDGGESFEPQRFEVRREFFFGDLRHGGEAGCGFSSLRSRAGGGMEVECWAGSWQARVMEKSVDCRECCVFWD